MDQTAFPALFRCSDEASNRYQRLYLRLVKVEYGILLLAAIMAMSFFSGPAFRTFYGMVFFAAIAVLLTRAVRRPEQDWYRCRALAESVKTMSWRYMMRAAPFEGADAQQKFSDHLRATFEHNRETAAKISADWAAHAQLTDEMAQIHAGDLLARKVFYLMHRVRDQRHWYVDKAKANRSASKWWIGGAVIVYGAGALMVLVRNEFPEWTDWPIEPVIVIAASILGWIQVKKFAELSAAYTVAANEIGLLEPIITGAGDEVALSAAINDAELAFSREHTLWIARQTT